MQKNSQPRCSALLRAAPRCSALRPRRHPRHCKPCRRRALRRSGGGGRRAPLVPGSDGQDIGGVAGRTLGGVGRLREAGRSARLAEWALDKVVPIGEGEGCEVEAAAWSTYGGDVVECARRQSMFVDRGMEARAGKLWQSGTVLESATRVSFQATRSTSRYWRHGKGATRCQRKSGGSDEWSESQVRNASG